MIRSYGPPDNGTPGNVGDLYIDSKTEEMYRCVKVIPDIVNQKNQFVTNYVHGPNTQYFWEKEQNAEFVVPDNCKIFDASTTENNTVNRLIRHIRLIRFIRPYNPRRACQLPPGWPVGLSAPTRMAGGLVRTARILGAGFRAPTGVD